MKDTTIIVYGPAGCGKTTNAEALREAYGCESIVDDFDFSSGDSIVTGGLHLTQALPRFKSSFATYIPFEEAMKKLENN